MTIFDAVLAIGEPMAIADMAEADYFAHPALSASGAKKLLSPSCPALFRWERDHPRADTKVFDEGHAAHQLVLGTGKPIRRIYADLVAQEKAHQTALNRWVKDPGDDPEPVLEYRIHADSFATNYAKEQAADARRAGEIPLLAKDVRVVLDMAKAIRRHPIAGKLFDPARGGQAEVSLFWHDEDAGVDRKCRLDWAVFSGDRWIVVDYKTARSAEPYAFAKQVANLNYHQQDAWYRDAVQAVLAPMGQPPGFVFVVQEKDPPYLVTLVELDPQTVAIGRAKNNYAMQVFHDCTAVDVWPGYSDEIELIGLPAWADRDY